MFGNSWRAGDGGGDHFDNIGPEEKCKFSYNCFLMDYSDFISFIQNLLSMKFLVSVGAKTVSAPLPTPKFDFSY